MYNFSPPTQTVSNLFPCIASVSRNRFIRFQKRGVRILSIVNWLKREREEMGRRHGETARTGLDERRRKSEFSPAVKELRQISVTPAESQRKHFSLLQEVFCCSPVSQRSNHAVYTVPM